jgi:hypothetical protein
MPLTLDATNAPLIVATAIGTLNDIDYRAHLDECSTKIIAPGKPYAFVYDGTRIASMPATCRKMQSDWINSNKATVARLNHGCGFAFDSLLTRNFLTAVHWISPPPYPYAVHATRRGALRWCLDRLVEAGDLPSPVAKRIFEEVA